MFHFGPFYEAEKGIKAAAANHLAVHQGHTANKKYFSSEDIMQNSHPVLQQQQLKRLKTFFKRTQLMTTLFFCSQFQK